MRVRYLILFCLLPVLLQAEGLPPLDSPPQLRVKAFELLGRVSVDRRDCLQRLLRGQSGRLMDGDALLALRDRLTRRCYQEAGYPNSGVLLPDQDVEDGRIRLRVVEGGLDVVRVTGGRLLNQAFYARRILDDLEAPLKLERLREKLLLLERHPAVKRMDARLLPGERLGESRLHLVVEEGEAGYMALSLDNYRRSPSVGSEHLGLSAGHYSLSGVGDRLDLELGLTRGARDFDVRYDRPFGPRLSLTAHAEYGSSVVIETPFKRLDIESDYLTAGLGLRFRPLHRLRDRLDLTLGLAYKFSRSRLLGDDFSFAPGVRDGESRLSLLSFGQSWQHQGLRERRLHTAWLLHSVFVLGVDALGATTQPGLPDGRFFAWRGHAQFRQRLDRHGRRQLALRGNIQLSGADLLPLEKFALGGVDTVRGYRENALVRDNGWSLSLELQVGFGGAGEGWKLVPFLDYGRAWNRSGVFAAADELASAGVGIQWKHRSLDAELWLARDLLGRDAPGNSPQDEGVHFQVRYHVL